MELKQLKDDDNKKNESDIQKLMRGWQLLIDVPEPLVKNWNKLYFPRYSRTLKMLLALFGDWETSFECMEYVYNHMKKQGMDCTLETVWKRTDLFLCHWRQKP